MSMTYNEHIIKNFKYKRYNDLIIESIFKDILPINEIERLKNNSLNEIDLKKYVKKIIDFPAKKIIKKGEKEKEKLKKVEKQAYNILKKNGLNPQEVKKTIQEDLQTKYGMYMKKTSTDDEAGKNLERFKREQTFTRGRGLFLDTLKKIFTFDKDTPVNLLVALGVVFIIATINTIAMGLFSAIFLIFLPPAGAQALGTALGAILIAPLTEDWFGKYMAVEEGMISEHLLVFNLYEFLFYFFMIVASGGTPLYALMLRIPGILMHYINGFLIRYGISKDKIDKTKFNSRLMLFIAIFLHAVWNFFATVGIVLDHLAIF